jgi:membrane fusion protein (multidrug efflux system)
VDIRDTDGHLLPQQTVAVPRFTTDVYQNALDKADQVVAKILHDNRQAVAASNR